MLQTEPETLKSKLKYGCLTFIKGVLGIILVGFLLNLFMNKDKEYDQEFPWFGSIWNTYSGSNSPFGDKQFKTLEECRSWAFDLKEKKSLKDGQWDYSCGTGCKYTDQSISNGRKVNTYECSELTK